MAWSNFTGARQQEASRLANRMRDDALDLQPSDLIRPCNFVGAKATAAAQDAIAIQDADKNGASTESAIDC